MKIIIAMDSFKGSMTSLEAGEAAKAGVLNAVPDAEVIVRPLADGGEGTMESLLLATQAVPHEVNVSGPLGTFVSCYLQMIYVSFLFPWLFTHFENRGTEPVEADGI